MTNQAKLLKKQLKEIGAKPYTGKDLDVINNFSKMSNVSPFKKDAKGLQVRTQRDFVEHHPKHGALYEYGKAMSVVKALTKKQREQLLSMNEYVRVRRFGEYDLIEY